MEHVIFFPAHDGSPAFRRVPSLDEAVRLVEHLRNAEGVSEVSCHALTEVPLAFRAWYRVEVPSAAEVPSPADVPEQVAAPMLDAAVVAAQVEPAVGPEPVLAAANGHATDGANSLGFFA